MAKGEDIPHCIRLAYETLCQHGGVDITNALKAVNEDGAIVFRFTYTEKVSIPNPENLPEQIPLRVDIPVSFPYDPPKIYSACREVQGFPHQDAETGKLCLLDESRSPLDEGRLLTYVEWARQWLQDAARGQLLQNGDPYELPDFSRRYLRKRLEIFPPVYTIESVTTWHCWQDKIGQAGTVSFRTVKPFKGIVPSVFRDSNKTVVGESGVAESLIDPRGLQIEGAWALLDSLCYHRHRPAQTYGELAITCERSRLDFDMLLRVAWRALRDDTAPCVILLGYPIPEKVGEHPVRVHWQPLFFDGIRRQFDEHKQKRCKRIKTDSVFSRSKHDGEFADHKPLLWGQAVTVSESSLYARGALPANLRTQKTAICGCGALGCLVAESFARGGVRRLRLFDQDEFELGNQCRHTLSGPDIGQSKSLALAKRLQSCNPLSDISGYATRLPMTEEDISRGESFAEELFSSDTILDCGMAEGGFQWLSQEAKKRDIRMAALFFNLHAKMLTLCISGNRISCYKVLCKLNSDIRSGKASFAYEEYNPVMTDKDKILPEGGCWHATFPAINCHVWMLVSAGIEVACGLLRQPADNQGRTVIIRRNSPAQDAPPSALTEIVWSKNY